MSDVYISGMKDRNRALNGDVVVIQVNTRDQWKVSPLLISIIQSLQLLHRERVPTRPRQP